MLYTVAMCFSGAAAVAAFRVFGYFSTSMARRRRRSVSSLPRNADTGGLVYENGLKEKRETARFSKEVCHDCRIAPVCGGGCAQKAMELYDTTDCVFGYTEEGINDFVLDRFEYSLLLGEMNGDKCIICR